MPFFKVHFNSVVCNLWPAGPMWTMGLCHLVQNFGGVDVVMALIALATTAVATNTANHG